ncbi:conserved repeat protein [Aequorivita sublithincola DSM 14238]|uniref:Conserved repeat protein n=1 Tax=Aequorivita sublithincola (strain DSM 14238 / LMG 21431 / ACAM 643 / 9-3) TaxID=746697 RepID=I3YWW4_AEQSU|nr:gliding motility-associated C-terminal domain-containing protein [Aequorivita sublithincola]AFL81482.1 conserved repeat protein [Aequorivita sublithincola DSM 14238]
MLKIITKLFASDKRFLISLIFIAFFGTQGFSQAKGYTDEGEVILPYSQEYLDQYNAALDKKAAENIATFRSRSKAEAFNNASKGNLAGACNLITCGSFEKADVSGGTFRNAVGGTNGQYQADAAYTCWNDVGTVDWSEGQYISYSQSNANVVYPGIIQPSNFDGGGFAIFSFRNEAINQTLTVVPNTVYTVCFEIAVIPRYNEVNANNGGGTIIEYVPNLQFGVQNGAVQISDPLTYTHANLVQHTTADFPSRLSRSTTGANQNPGGWTNINPYWENRCITFRSGPSATSVNVFYKTGNPGRSVVLVDGLRLAIEGYANAPVVSPTDKTYCAPTQVQLDSFVTSTTPGGAQLRWTTNPDLSVTADYLPQNPTRTTPGVWYAFYYNPTAGCTSPSRKLTLRTTDLDSSFTKTNVTCFGQANGAIDLTVTGGSVPYTYLWSTTNGSGLNLTAQDQFGLTAGTYNVTVTDDNGCKTLESVVISETSAVNPPISGGNKTECKTIPIQTLTASAIVPTGQTVVWYLIPVGGTPVSPPTLNTVGVKDYYAEAVVTASGCKSSTRTKVTLKIINTPTVDDPADVTRCDSYTLPALTNGNYFTGSGGTGTPLFAGNNITSTQTIYVYAETSTTPNCTAENSFVVTINPTPTVDDPADVTRCDSYTLPALTNGNYFTGSGGTGTPLFAGNNITSTQTIYVYAETSTTPNCTAENSFVVTINPTPTVDDPADVTRCDSYTLPALTNGNYFTGSGGTGTPLFAGNNITSTQTIYVYAETSTTPNCTAENSFVVTINPTPTVDDPADVTRCDSYTLPALTNGNYFTGSGGTGTPLFAGNNITSTQTIYVYAETSTTPNCTAENSFVVTINPTPTVDDPADVTRCDSYTLPALTNGNYFTGSGGTGTPLFAGNNITSTQTIYVYAETSTTPNCTAENSFVVTINPTPTVDDPADVTRCDSYTLPALTNGNYFTGSGGTGTPLFAGNNITSTQTIYVYAETSTTPNCTAENSFVVTINPTPTVDDPADVTRCDSYTLPALTNGNYFTGSGGTGTPLFAGNNITSTQTIYVYAETSTTPNCTAENSFVVTINPTPTVDDPADVTRCDSYTLPALTNGNYFTGSGGTGTPLFAGNNITSTQTIYVYAETSTTPNCTAENSFVVTINPTPTVDDPADVTRCDSYTLPALTNGNYFTGSGGTGTPLFAGNNITSTQTIYVYAETSTTPNCTAENSFVVTINPTPTVDDPADVTRCDSYTLPALTNGNYFTGSGGTGTPLFAGNNITSTQTIYVYAETSTTPNCTAENSFVVTINPTPTVDDPADVTRCDSYTLPALTNGNYFTGSGGTGTPLFAGNNITSTQTIYVYAETSTTPNCTAENSFVVTINVTPLADNPSDVSACGNYTLPALVNGAYYTSQNGQNPIAVGTVIIATQTIYVYAETGTVPNCFTENSFIVTINNCGIILEKIATPNNPQGCTPIAPGESISYTFKVSIPTGSAPVNNVVITDPLLEAPNPIVPIVYVSGDDGDTILEDGELWTYSASYVVTQQDITNGLVQNTATVNGQVQTSGNPYPVSTSGSVTVNLCQNAEMSIVKSSSSETGNCISFEEGNTIDYKFVVSNDGDVDITNVVITDPLFLAPNPVVSIVYVSGDDGDGILNIDEDWTYTVTYTITQSDVDAGSIVNTAEVDGNSVLGAVDTATSNTVTVLICQAADIAIVKESDQVPGNDGCVALEDGDIITYTFRVTNEGNVSIDNVVITDPLVGLSAITGPTGDTGSDGILGLNEVWEYTATYTVTQDDVNDGEVTNQATVNGLAMNPSNTPVIDDSHPTSTTADGDTVVVICQNPDIAIVKESDQVPGNDGCVALEGGDIITYTFRVTNEGNVSIDNVVVTDPLVGLSAITGPTGDTGSDGILGLNEVWEYTATYTVTQDDIDNGEVTNQATVNGLAMNPSNTPVTDDSHPTSTTADGDTVVVICQAADIAIVKESDQVPGNDGCVALEDGDIITYTFRVTNEGNVSIDNVVVTDPLVGLSAITGPIGDTGSDGILGLNEVWEYTATYTVTQDDVNYGEVTNQATVNGLAINPSNTPVTDDSHPTSTTADGDTVVVICQAADIAIVKESDQVPGNDGCVALEDGDIITYTFRVTNEGNVSIDNVVVTDPLVGLSAITGPTGDTGSDGILGLNEVWEYTATYTVTQDDVNDGEVTNQATVNGLAMNPSNTPVTDDSHPTSTTADGDTVVVICQAADIAIVKESDQVPGNDGCVALEDGDIITYTFRVTNEGNVSIDNVVVTDPLVGLSAITGPTGDTGSDGILGLNEVWEYTATYTVTQDDVNDGEVTNQATVNGLAMNPSNTPVTDDSHPTSTTADGDTVVVICQAADIAIVKESDQVPGNDGCVALEDGDIITYTFRVTNEGNVSIDNVVVTDPLVGLSAITGPIGDTGSDGILGLNEVWEYTATYTVTQDDVNDGEVTNQATVNGLAINPSNTPVIDDSHPTSTTADGDTVVVICQNPDIAIVKESDQVPGNDGCVALEGGDIITYTFRVTNEGNVSIDNVVVTDPLVGLSAITGPTGDTGSDGILGLNEVWEYTATYTVTQDDIDNGEVTNQATVNGLAMNPSNTPVTDDSHPTSTTADGDTVVVICQAADIAIVKESDQVPGNDGCVALEDGDIITYTFRVTNEGNVSIDNVVITDPLVGLSAITGPTGDTGSDGILGLNEVWEYTATYTVTQDDVNDGEVTNQATVNGLAMNPSNTPVIDDSHPTSTTADGDTVVVICQNPDIAIVKESDQVPGNDGCVALEGGDIITYTFRVTNEGNVSIDNVVVTDPLVGLSAITGPTGDTGSDGILGLNEVWEYTATYTVTQDDIDNGEVTNQATVNGLAMNPSNTPVTDDSHPTSTTADGDTVVVICQAADIAIVKESDQVPGNDGCVALEDGDIITYTFRVTNEGNVSIDNVVITDPLVGLSAITGPTGDTGSDGILGLNEVWEYTATYTVTQDDIDNGEVTNQATVNGLAMNPSNTPVTDDSHPTSTTEDGDTVVVICQNPDIAIVKTGVFNDVDGNDCADAGIDTITYTFTVTNEGNVSLSNITVTDPLLEAPNPVVAILYQSGDTDADGKLDVTETWIYTATSYVITQDDIDAGNVTNQATAVGTSPAGDNVEDQSGTDINNDDATVIELCQDPAIAIVKTGIFNDENQNGCTDVDETITYTFSVTNEGNVSLSNIVVDDPLLGGPIAGPDSGDTDGDGKLDVTETWIYTGSYVITQDDIDTGEVINQATATGTAPDQSTVSDLSGSTTTTDDSTVIELCQDPAIAIVKTGIFNDENQNDCSDVDETISYTFTVTNEGNVSLSNVTITDPLITTITGPTGDTDADGELDVTEIWTYSGIYAITQDDIDAGEVENQATAEGTAPDASVVSDLSDESSVLEDDPTVIELCQDPAIAIVKTGIFNDENQDNCSDVDETITYTFTVTNEGNVSLNFVEVTDPLITIITGPTGDTDGDSELDVTEVWTFTGTYAITQDDIDAGEVINQAKVKGQAPNGDLATDLSDESSVLEDDPTVIELCQDPTIAIVKTGIFNDENQDNCSDVDETITYTFTVTNEGNVSLSNVTVTDPLIAIITGPTGDTDNDRKLDVTETWVYTGTYAITQDDIDAGEVINQATAEGIAPNQSTVTDLSDESSVLEDDPTVTELCQDPVIAIVKTGIFNDENQNDCSDVDETISYTFTVTNQGNVSLSNVSVTDPLIATITGPTGDTNGDGVFDVTETWIYTGTYAITQADIDAGQVTNQATAEGTAPDASVVSDLSDESSVLENDPTVIELCQNPKIALIKTGVVDDTNGNGCADVGETIDYSFIVFNLGNVTLSNIIITDPLVTVNGGPITLAPGATDETSFTAIYTITQGDIDAGLVINQATVTGTDNSGTIVSDLSDDNSELEDDPTITELCQNPLIALIKVGVPADENGNGCADVGETIIYSFSVKNTGNVALTNVMVTDPLVDVVGGPISLVAGQEDVTTFKAVYTVTQTDVDAGFIENQATADGIAPNGDMVSDQSDNNSYLENDPTITVLCQNPSISLEKTGVFNDENGDGASEVGETISYAFAVTNTGDVTLYNIMITDPLPGIQIFGGPIAKLEPGEVDSTTFTTTYAITQEDIENGEVVNQATVTGEDISGTIVTDDSDDPTDLTNNDTNGDGDPDDPTVVILPNVLPITFVIYNGITPNNDGINDFFLLEGISNWPNNNVKIFNRWGVLVFETDGYGGSDDKQNVFSGISEGRVTVEQSKELPTGTYFYILTFPGENPGKGSYNGYLYINR